MKAKIIKRGYRIDLDKIEEGYLYSEYVCTAEMKSQAKSKLLGMCKYDSLKVRWDDNEITFLTIPIVRYVHADVVLYNGEEMPRWRMFDVIEKEKHDKELYEILNNKSITHCYIRKRGSYYQENNCGYTEFKLFAGVYTVEDAVQSARGCRELDIIPVNVKEHNEHIQSQIDKLKSKLL